jgi:hypothetical protein
MRWWTALRDRLETLTARDRRALRMGLAVFVPVMAWLLVARPYLLAWTDARDRLSAERTLLSREEEVLASATTLPVAVADAEFAASRATDRLLRAPNAPLAEARLTEWLEQMAGLSRVLLLRMSAESVDSEELEPGSLQPIRLAVNGESDLQGVMTFLLRVEESPLLLSVRELLIEPVIERPRSNRRRNEEDEEPPSERITGVVRFTIVVEAYIPPDMDHRAVEPEEAGL